MGKKTVKFQQMPVGSNSISAVKSGASLITESWTTDGPGGGTGGPIGTEVVNISVNRDHGVWPAGILFTAEVSGWGVTDDLGELRYEWDFGDLDGSGDVKYFTAHEKAATTFGKTNEGMGLLWDRVYDVDGVKTVVQADEGTPAGTVVTFLGNSTNRAFGKHVGHVYPDAGMFTATLTVSRRNGDGSIYSQGATKNINIEEQDDYFTGNRTIYVNPDGDYSDVAAEVTAGARTFNDINAAFGDLADPGVAPYIRVLLRRGKTHTLTAQATHEFGQNNNWAKMFIGPYGIGADPIVLGDELNANVTGQAGATDPVNAAGENAIWGIDSRGDYDAANPVTPFPDQTDNSFAFGQSNFSSFKTVYRVSSTGKRRGVNGFSNYSNMVLCDLFITNWADYGYQIGGDSGSTLLSGCWIMQKPGAVHGAAPDYTAVKDTLVPNHGPLRGSNLDEPFVMDMCRFMSSNSWAGPGNQDCFRVGRSTDIGQTYIEEANFQRIVTECKASIGSGVAEEDPVNGYGVALPRRFVYEKIYKIMVPEGGSLIGSNGVSGTIVRNVLGVVNNAPGLSGSGSSVNMFGGDDNTDKTYNDVFDDYTFDATFCCVVDLRSSANQSNPMSEKASGAFWRVIERIENNLYVFTRRSDALDSGISVDTTTIIEPTYIGRTGLGGALETQYAMNAETCLVGTPTTDVAAVAGSVPPPLDDLYGRIRPYVNPTKGPIERNPV